ncbi:uncharacterized protein [Macrobrachium rosenbergii]|uniref:uncharacterized protein n=1 Tax=Macrobrachium rosenbergii TaxID=79674 RepID=UPI0034D49F89
MEWPQEQKLMLTELCSNRVNKSDAWKTISDAIEIDRAELERKIKGLMAQLRREIKSIKEWKSGNVYTGASYGILYGLPQIHKESTPSRPIMTSYDIPNYKLAKLLVPLLAPLTSNNHSLNNSTSFKEAVLCQDPDLFMVSLDVESMFTNVPVGKTIQIILDKIFVTHDTVYNNFNKSDFKELLQLAVLDTAFVFSGKSYKQIDGMAMGSPLGPTFANIFMCSLEDHILDNCPLAYHPLFYRRYIDDTFLLCRSR